MEEWNKKLRELKDESENPYITQQFAETIFQQLIPRNKLLKIKNKDKFNQRLGPEFDLWTEHLEEKFPKVLVRAMLNDDDFWKLTLETTKSLR
jgi:hypothetical protein